MKTRLKRKEYAALGGDDAFTMACIVFGKDPRDMPVVSNRNSKPPQYPTGETADIINVYSWLEGPPSRLALNQLHQYKYGAVEYTRRIVPPYFQFEDDGDYDTLKDLILELKDQAANDDSADTGYHGLKTSDL